MGVEAGVGYIDDLVVTNPESTDVIAEGDDHLRLTKAAVRGSFTSLGREAVTKTAAEINNLVGDGDTGTTLNSPTLTTPTISSPVINGNAYLNTKVIDIGDWNMDTTSLVSIAHGLTLSKIRNVCVLIRGDSDTNYADFNLSQGTGTGTDGIQVNTTNVDLRRFTGGAFDNTGYDSTGFNRGWITIQYTD